MAVLEDPPGEPSGDFISFTMSGTIRDQGDLVLLANGDVDGVHRNIAIRLTEWQISYLAERVKMYWALKTVIEAEP